MINFLFFVVVAIFTGLLVINLSSATNGVAMLLYGIVYLWSLAGITVLFLWAKNDGH